MRGTTAAGVPSGVIGGEPPAPAAVAGGLPSRVTEETAGAIVDVAVPRLPTAFVATVSTLVDSAFVTPLVVALPVRVTVLVTGAAASVAVFTALDTGAVARVAALIASDTGAIALVCVAAVSTCWTVEVTAAACGGALPFEGAGAATVGAGAATAGADGAADEVTGAETTCDVVDEAV